MKHTPEPWDYVYEHGAWEGYHEPDSGEFETVFRTDSEAKAARIVACVNACAGIEDPQEIRDRHEQLKSGLIKVENQRIGQIMYERDKLLEALEAMINHTTMEFAERSGFGPQRQLASEVYDRIKWGVPNAGGGQS